MSNIISFLQKLIKGGVGIRAGGLENFSKVNKRGGTIIRYSRVGFIFEACCVGEIHILFRDPASFFSLGKSPK